MIKKAVVEDSKIIAELAVLLWPKHDVDEMAMDFEEYINSNSGVVFIYFEGETPVGFAQSNLRYDYVEGTKSSPVGYLEGIFVKEESRNKGIAKKLMASCEEWARVQGCTEFASDCELTNQESLNFHLNIGFQEANRVICFSKKI